MWPTVPSLASAPTCVKVSSPLPSKLNPPQAHAQCSETFYKKEVEADIRAEPSKTAQERQRMLELLKRFEEDSAAQPSPEDEDDGDEDGDDLAHRLQSVNLGGPSHYTYACPR
jgi:hypothetical protein